MNVIHMSEAEAARDFAGLLARVRAGDEVVIGAERSAAVVLRAANDLPVRRLSDSLRLAREHQSAATLDDTFAADLEEAVQSHPESLQISWE